MSLGDYYILSGRPNRGEKTYQEAWEYLSAGDIDERIKARDDHLGKVRMLQRVFPPRYYNTDRAQPGTPPPDSFETGTMSFSFTVAPTGRIVELRHLETQPRELSEFSKVVGRSLRRMIYRPRLQNMELVPTRDVIYTHEFYYSRSDVEAAVAPPSEAETAPEESGSE